MLEKLLSNKNKELVFKSGSILENINSTDKDAMVTDIDEIGSSYGKNVVVFLNTVRNEIVPAMDKVENILLESIQNKNFTIQNTYNIIKLTLPSLFTNLEEYGGLNLVGNGALPLASVTLPTPKKEDIRNWFVTDSDDINYDLEEVLNRKSDDELVDLWEKYIYSFSADNMLLKDLNLFHYSKTEELMLIYAAVRNLSMKDPGEVSNLMAFKNSIVSIYDFVKAIIKKYISLYNVSAETKLVHNIRIIDNYTNIYVFDKAYEKFIEQSVNGVDSIIGYAIVTLRTDTTMFSATIEKVLEKEDEYYKANMRNIDMLKLKSNKDKIEGYVLTYRVHGSRIYKEVISELSSTVQEETFNSIYKDLLIKTEEEHNELDVELFVRNLFGMIYPRLKKFLDITTQIDTNGIESDLTMTPNEVILYATLELITSELMDQVAVNEVSSYKV
jgi:hypothetical protein